MTDTVNSTSNVLSLTLTNLEEFVNYTVTVRAFTAAGVGPYSFFPALNRTEEAGILKNILCLLTLICELKIITICKAMTSALNVVYLYMYVNNNKPQLTRLQLAQCCASSKDHKLTA